VQINLPDKLKIIIGAANFEENDTGESGTAVFRLETPGGVYYLKTGDAHLAEALAAEHGRLNWLRGKAPVPQVHYFGYDTDGRAYLLIAEMPGKVACDEYFAGDLPRLARSLGRGLRLLHNLDTTDCPFNERLDVMIERARQNVEAGLVDEDDFDETRQGKTADEVFAELLALPRPSENPVFTHGDFCLPNVMLDPETWEVCGFIDLGRAGVSDPFRDLALCARSFDFNWSADVIPLIFEEYGTAMDYARIEYYKLIDEFY
jgi:aminoglycoside 3'-phosphotransferase II